MFNKLKKYFSSTIPFTLGIKSFFSREASVELARLNDVEKYKAYREQLNGLDGDKEVQLAQELSSSAQRIEDERLNSCLRIAQIKANTELKRVTLEYELECLEMKGNV